MKRRWLLPVIALAAAIAATLVVLLIPKGQTGSASAYLPKNSEGYLVIRAADLSGDQARFLRVSEDSRIELIARRGDDGKAKVALGTCQSCNGSPGAYYTQEGNQLKCNNCGLTFRLSVIDAPGGGCHPITIDPAIISETEEGLLLNAAALMGYEPLFEGVAPH